jgi:hypothetical protein
MMVAPALLVLALAASPAERALDAGLQEVTSKLTVAAEAVLAKTQHHALVRSDNASAYASATEESKDAARAAFAPMCAAKLEAIAAKWTPEGSNRERGSTALALGHSLGTHFQVQCEHGLPMDEPECDELAAQLQVTVANGAPFSCGGCTSNSSNATEVEAEAEAEALVQRSVRRILPDEEEKTAIAGKVDSEMLDPAAKPLESVEEWCAVLFDSFFAKILEENAAAEGGEEEAAALLGHKMVLHSKAIVKKVRAAENRDAWAPMRALLESEAAELVMIAKRRNASGNSTGPVYGKALHEANEAAKKAKEEVYAAAEGADAATAKEAFLPACASALQEVADRYLNNGLRGAELTLGLSMATHLQVQCHDGIPIEEEKCDEFATDLLEMLDAKNPLIKPTPPPAANNTNGTNGTNGTNATEAPAEEAPAEEAALAVAGRFRSEKIRKALSSSGVHVLRNDTNGSNATGAEGPMEHGEEWCGAFFDAFLEGVIADVKAAAEEGAEGEGEEAAAEEEAAFLVRKSRKAK